MRYIILALILLINIDANELKNSTSPYLLQHKDNPVNWMEWSDRAFKKAKREKKFIFLSIGYSTCHWCHVMAKESFSKKDIAKILNRYFVSIKVDKERRSDIDSYYQFGFRVINQRAGGWPLTVILLPNKKPIFFATYLPKESLKELLLKVVNSNKDELKKIADSIDSLIKDAINAKAPRVNVPPLIVKRAIREYKKIYDFKNFGFSIEPKFPEAASIDMLLNLYMLSKDKEALNMATNMLLAMAKGGIYDQIEGGFFRYSVDRAWQIPHFEKMLYTNAELILVYSKAYKITKRAIFAKVVKEIIANIEKYFNYNGVYYSAINADSKDEDGIEKEGYYYIFEYERVYEYLIKKGVSKQRAKRALEYFGIDSMGNFEGEYSHAKIKEFGKFSDIRELLKEYRAKKELPFIDKKIITAWNALYIDALFYAGVIDKKFTKMAIDRLNRLTKLMYKNKRLYHYTLLPHKPKQLGLLEDYSFFAKALFSAYEATLKKEYLELYNEVVKSSVKLFYKSSNFYLNQQKSIKATFEDGAYKSAKSVMIQNIIKYVAVNEEYKLLDIANSLLEDGSYYISNALAYYPTLLNAYLMINELILIKGKKESLQALNLDDILYPYIYKKDKNINEFLICGISSCYKSLNDINRVKEEIKKYILK